MDDLKINASFVHIMSNGDKITLSTKYNLKTGEVAGIVFADYDLKENCEREYIILNGEQIDVLRDDNGQYWAGDINDLSFEYTENYKEHQSAMSKFSIVEIIQATHFLHMLSLQIGIDDKTADDIKKIIMSFEDITSTLKTEEKCRKAYCNGVLYKSDLPQYNYICPECDNF